VEEEDENEDEDEDEEEGIIKGVTTRVSSMRPMSCRLRSFFCGF
jgi:hypothetical protein